MANDKDTTTTTTETTTATTQKPEQATTTTTTEKPEPGDRPGSEASPRAERQGEITPNKGADTKILGDDTPEDPAEAREQALAGARETAQKNHAAEKAA